MVGDVDVGALAKRVVEELHRQAPELFSDASINGALAPHRAKAFGDDPRRAAADIIEAIRAQRYSHVATYRLPRPDGAVAVIKEVHGISLRAVKVYDMEIDLDVIRYDLGYGAPHAV